MKVLLIHQNFPGQYKHLGPAPAARGDQVVALTCKAKEPGVWKGIQIHPYKIKRGSGKSIHPWVGDWESKAIRAEACYDGALELRAKGFTPDVILAHHGWGEPMFLKDVWPEVRMGIYCELYHCAHYPQAGFDPEFDKNRDEARAALRIRVRNQNNHVHFDIAEAGISPTGFQAATFPTEYRDRISVIHDGIDTGLVRPNPDATLKISDDLTLTREDEVITFINRNLEPYRGYHIFMRALPQILRRRPNAHVTLIGGDEVSYGAAAPKGQSWKQIFIDEVRDQISDADWARVHFLGRVPYDRFLSMMQVSRAHVYLTYPFVLSWSLLEAMAAECTIIASDTAPLREVMQDGETGLLFDFFDKDALVEKLCLALEDPDLRARLGANARAHVVQNYDLKTTCLPQQLAWVDALAAQASTRRPKE